MSLKDIADEFGQELEAFSFARSLLITGSVARGWDDEYSDIDLFCICEKLPNTEKLKNFYSEIGAEFKREHHLFEDEIANLDVKGRLAPYLIHKLVYKGCDVDVLKFRLLENIRQYIDEIITEEEDIGDEFSIWKEICEGQIVFDKDGDVEDMRDELLPIPLEIKERLITKQVDSINSLFKTSNTELKRKNKFFLDWKLSESIVSLYKIILILNDKYPRSWKWLTKEVRYLKYKPNNLEDEVEWIINQDNSLRGYENKLGKLRGLIEEMVDKVEGDVNIKSLKDIRI